MAITFYATNRLLTPKQRKRRKAEIALAILVTAIGTNYWATGEPKDYPQIIFVFLGANAFSLALLHCYDLIGHNRVSSSLKKVEHLPPSVRGLEMMGKGNTQDPMMFLRIWGLFFPFFAFIFFLGNASALTTPQRWVCYFVAVAVLAFWMVMTVRKNRESKPAEQISSSTN